MTTQLPRVQQALQASGALTAITTNIAMGTMPEDRSRPYVVWTLPTVVPENNLSAAPEEDDQRVQIDFYSEDQSAARRMMQAGVDAIENLGNIIFGPWYGFEEETRLHRWSFDLEVWNSR